MNPKEILKACIEIYQSFRPASVTLDTHTEKWLLDNQITNDEDAGFISDVFYGCVRYKDMIDVVLSSFYYNNPSVSRAERDVYMILTYLAVFRLDDISFASYKRLVAVYDAHKMATYLRFMFDEKNLEAWMKTEWYTLYDRKYVDEFLVANVSKYIPDAEELMRQLEHSSLANDSTELTKTTPVTQTQPFNLTRPRVRKIPEPEAISVSVKAKAVPPSTYARTDNTIQILEKVKEGNRESMKQKYADPSKQPFQLKTSERPSNADKIRAEVEAARQAEMQPEKKKMVRMPSEPATVRLNAAAILREDARYKRRLEEEARIILDYERHLRDASAFDKWKTDMQALDDEKRAAEIERRRLEMQLSAEEAIEARKKKEEENRILAERMKEQLRLGAERRELEEKEKLEKNKQVVETVQEIRENAAKVKKDVEKRNNEEAKEVKRVQAELERMKKEEEREEKLKKEDLIRQIRALENVPKRTAKVIDPTETAGYGLLNEMSISELRERLALQKVKIEEQKTAKRQEILSTKREKNQELLEKMERLARLHAKAEESFITRKDQEKVQESHRRAQEKSQQDAKLIELQEKLEVKRQIRKAEQERLAEERKAIMLQNQFLRADKNNIEEKKFAQQEKGLERAARLRQMQEAENVKLEKEIQEKDTSIRTLLRTKEEKEKKKIHSAYDESVRQKTLEYNQTLEDELRRKKERVENERSRSSPRTRASPSPGRTIDRPNGSAEAKRKSPATGKRSPSPSPQTTLKPPLSA